MNLVLLELPEFEVQQIAIDQTVDDFYFPINMNSVYKFLNGKIFLDHYILINTGKNDDSVHLRLHWKVPITLSFGFLVVRLLLFYPFQHYRKRAAPP